MGFLDRIFKTTETRSVDPSWTNMQRDMTTPVNARSVENLATAMACVQAVSSGVASLPAWVFQRGENGRQYAPNHPLQRLIDQGPNPYQTWPDFMEWLIASALLRGNALVEIVRTSNGRLEALKCIPWEHVSVQLLPSGRLAYDIMVQTGLEGTQGRTRRLLDTEVVHLRDRSDNGYIGRSRLSRAGGALGAASALQDLTQSQLNNGYAMGGIVTVPHTTSPDFRERMRADLKRLYSGADKAGQVFIGSDGMGFEKLSITPEDAELLASRRFSGEEIARIFGVPPSIIGDLQFGTFTNAETAGRWFAQHTLTPWVRKVEAAFTRSVFSAAQRSTYYLDIDLSGLLRGDPETRWQSHKIAVDSGILDADEVREIEGWNPRGQADG